MSSDLHEERLCAAADAVRDAGARSVVDLGCGDGALFLRLADDPSIERLVGLDISAAALARLRARLALGAPRVRRIELRQASMTDPQRDLAGFDCATLIETIEHVDPADLSRLERAVFAAMRPLTVIVTTPNAEFNALLGVPARRFRHPDHRFEWPRARFRRWARRVAGGVYAVGFRDIGGCHPDLGGASQMAVFRAATGPGAAAARPHPG